MMLPFSANFEVTAYLIPITIALAFYWQSAVGISLFPSAVDDMHGFSSHKKLA
jgi:hypothetical protein